MVRRFAIEWKLAPHTIPPWEAFIGRRYSLREKTKDQKKTPAEKSKEWALLRERYLPHHGS